MNLVMFSRILEITDKKSRFSKIREMSSNWRAVIVVSVGALTLKTIAEQLIMLTK